MTSNMSLNPLFFLPNETKCVIDDLVYFKVTTKEIKHKKKKKHDQNLSIPYTQVGMTPIGKRKRKKKDFVI